jgi:hypothetical protein
LIQGKEWDGRFALVEVCLHFGVGDQYGETYRKCTEEYDTRLIELEVGGNIGSLCWEERVDEVAKKIEGCTEALVYELGPSQKASTAVCKKKKATNMNHQRKHKGDPKNKQGMPAWCRWIAPDASACETYMSIGCANAHNSNTDNVIRAVRSLFGAKLKMVFMPRF